MKRIVCESSFLILLVGLSTGALAHGPGHVHRDTESVVVEDVVDGGQPAAGPDREGLPAGSAPSAGKSFKPVVESERIWGASLTTGWESRHVHYGVDETGPGGAYTTEVGVWIQNLTLSVWSGFGTGNEFQEWDFTAAYRLDLGPVFFIPGYNFRYSPSYGHAGHSSEGHADHEDDHDEHGHADEHDEDGHEHTGHSHQEYGNELFFVLGTDRVPFVKPSMVFVWDLNNTPGAILEFRLDGDVPVWKDVLTLQPYALLGLNFGYTTRSSYGWNNFQFGLEATWRVSRNISVFGGVNYSVAMTALESIGQDNVVWANAGVSFSY